MSMTQPQSTAIRVVRELEPFGVELDADLHTGLDEAATAAFRDLFDRHHLVVFRGQQLSAAEQVRLLSIVGPVLLDEMDGTSGYVSTEPSIGSLGRTQLAFHSDMACAPSPLIALGLYAEEVQGDTCTWFADNVTAAATLPPELRQQVEGRRAAHYWPRDIADGMQARNADVHEGWPGSEHPVLMTHPRTGETLLYVTRVHTHHIVGLDPDESRRLLDELERHTYDRANTYEHRWTNGDLVVWDNVALQHGRPPVSPETRRTLRRVVCGEPYQHLIPPDVAAYYISG